MTQAPSSKKILMNQRNHSAAKAILLWPLVLYSLIQIVTNFIPSHHLQPHNELLSSKSHFSLRDSLSLSSSSHSSVLCQAPAATTLADDGFDSSNSELVCIQATNGQKLRSSSNSKISTPLLLSYASKVTSLAQHYLSSLLDSIQRDYKNGRTLFGGRILIAEASSLYQAHQDKGIIILNSTNFNTELIQHKHPFPHLTLIEYYVSFCGFCTRFKDTYTKLAKELYPWRNVIRLSAIDLGISSNSPIAHSWSVDVVPTLRIHPPPNPSLAESLNAKLSSLNAAKLSESELQKNMFVEYNSSHLMIKSSLSSDVTVYKDNVPLLKSDLLRYIQSYVKERPSELPVTWPNLRPVQEASLAELRRLHPRQELFLIIEGPTKIDSDQSSSTSLGLSIMLELSSSAAWKAIRYVRSSENRALIEDVIAQQKRTTSEQQANRIVEQVENLNNLLTAQSSSNNNNILLIHIDDSHSPAQSGASSSAFPYMTIVTGADLLTMEKLLSGGQQGSLNTRAKRASHNSLMRNRRSLFNSEEFNKMDTTKKIELITNYVKQTYTETSEDREFVEAVNFFDENSKLEGGLENWSKVVESLNKELMQQDKLKIINQSATNAPSAANSTLSSTTTTTTSTSSTTTTTTTTQDQTSDKFLEKLFNIFTPQEKDPMITCADRLQISDYDDKLKAIRYMLFNEVPRHSLIDKSLTEQQEKLNTLVNMVTVIKSYFPFTDSSSTQFIDGVLSYLLKQQSRLSSVKTQEFEASAGFDTRAFKQELKRLESENKRLPEIKDWKHCTGYPCALWRLFHTLTAFEYKKLEQIRQPMSSVQLQATAPQQQPLSTGLQQTDSNLSPSVEAITMKSTNSVGPPSPVERLVSPPSATTSFSLTIVTPNSSQVVSDNINEGIGSSNSNNNNNNHNKLPLSETDLPTPVLLVMRDYVTTFFSCTECANKFRIEAADLSLERIRQQEPAEFSILWLWETHNRVNKRLSVDPETNPPERPKIWFPSYDQCTNCYKKAPSFLKDTTVDAVSIFHESVEWNRPEVLSFLLKEYTKHPMDSQVNLFGDQVLYGFKTVVITCLCCLFLIVVLRCATQYVERQRRHKATLLNGNGARYTLELQ